METKSYVTMDYNELEQMAKKLFGINYEYVCEEELSNDSSKTYNIDQKDIDSFDWEEWAKFLEGRRQWRARLLLTRLVMLAHIPMGDILIKVSW